MKLFVLLSRVPYPLDKGDKLRAYHQLKELKNHFTLKVVALSDGMVKPEDLEKLKSEFDIEILQLNKFKIYLNLFAGLFSDKPYQVNYFFQRSVARKIRGIIADFAPDHIYCQLVRTAEYVKNIHNIPKTIDYMDAFSKGMDRRIANSSGIRKVFIRSEATRLLKYENLIYDYFENKTIISEQDRSTIYHPERGEIVVVPNGVDFNFFQPIDATHSCDVVFTGNMNYPPNVDGAIFLVKEILPLLQKERPEIRVIIAGATPSNDVLALASQSVKVTGWVDDIRNAYAESKVFIAPMRIGTGLQNKLLEAMAMGIPSVTTSLANNALRAKPEKEVLIGDSAEELASCILKVLLDGELSKNLSVNGRTYVSSNYSWTSATGILIDKIKG